MGRKRGVDLPNSIDAAIHDVADSANVSDNKTIVTLLNLGLTFYHKLPTAPRGKVWRPDQTFAQQQSLRGELKERAEELVTGSRLDSFVIFRASAEKKRLLQSKAQDAKLDVSKFIRSRVLEEKED